MKQPFRHGLVVGKFCPLHRGHEYLINTALSRCQTVNLISYTAPEFPRCGADARERWFAERFPQVRRLVLDQPRFATLAATHGWPGEPTIPDNDAPAAIHRALCAGLCHNVFDIAIDAVFTSETYGDGFARALTRAQTRRADAPTDGVVHVCVDLARHVIPVSGSTIRRAPHAHRKHVSAVVHADFVERICLLGGESSGKTTTSRELARRLREPWVAEYGREHWDACHGQLGYDDLLLIAQTQVARENALARTARRRLICDTNPLTTWMYCQDLFGRAEARLETMANRHYDHIFLLAPDFPFVQDGTRRDDDFRRRQHQWYQRELASRGMPYTLLEGSFDQRIDQAMAALDAQSGPL